MRRENVISAIRFLSPTARLVIALTTRVKRRTVPTVIGASLGIESGLLPLIRVHVWKFNPAIGAVVRVVLPPLRPFAPFAIFDVSKTAFVRHILLENRFFSSG